MGYRLDINKYDKDGNETNIYYGTKLIGYLPFEHEWKLNCIKYLVSEKLLDYDSDYLGYYCSPTIEVNYEQLCKFINLYCYDLINDFYDDYRDDYTDDIFYSKLNDVIDNCHQIIETVTNGCDEFDTIQIGWC